MIDLHTHFLPNYDDGCTSLEEARECLLKSLKNGVKRVVLTPHFTINDDKEELFRLFDEFKKQINDIDIEVSLGAEMMYTRDFLKGLKDKKAVTISNSEYLLIEFEFFDSGIDIRSALFDVSCLGYKVILAHPERYEYLSIKELKSISNDGVLLQVNTTSLTGDNGNNVKRRAMELYKLGLIDFVSSDAHKANGKRCPNLNKSFLKYIKKPKDINF